MEQNRALPSLWTVFPGSAAPNARHPVLNSAQKLSCKSAVHLTTPRCREKRSSGALRAAECASSPRVPAPHQTKWHTGASQGVANRAAAPEDILTSDHVCSTSRGSQVPLLLHCNPSRVVTEGRLPLTGRTFRLSVSTQHSPDSPCKAARSCCPGARWEIADMLLNAQPVCFAKFCEIL